ncbi:sigma-70 family RNA polymerase sigma factor [Allokutzneria sp. A3M-2-11 16]|uniref:RNA polymerase sigma factor n=1 Tax=Allokutzneria sp. A3M-2-11 16 TaxID=2962043 RepID=UPI0020B86C76|nr:sigma-70 family RNA polymerase sigma factor [Allokutzneria sp. A3M-2-11 16]MCP3802987.1 sigma-70 family RNA polymerase sigma factor [Allokutzneria sp. A3M-2-11 16]
MRDRHDVTKADDAGLLRRIVRGDRLAFDELYRRHATWITLRLRRRARDEDLVTETLQDTFLTVWRSAGSYAGRGEVAGWLWTIASSRLIDGVRRRSRSVESVGEPDEYLLTTPSAEDEAMVPLYDARLAAALKGLAPELRDVLQATVLDGLTSREAAVLLGIPEGTVKTRVRRARGTLREAMS